MATRHIIMVVKDQKTVVAQYGQWDGYPDGQGIQVLAFAKALDIDDHLQHFKDALDKCFFTTEDAVAKMWEERQTNGLSHPQISRDTSVGIFELILDNAADNYPLVDSSDFADNSLMCEWAYIIDLDNEQLEVYEGFNNKPVSETNRFQGEGKDNYDGSTTYYPVVLTQSWFLGGLPSDEEFINKLCPPDEEQDVPEFNKDNIATAIDRIRIATDGVISERICNYIEANLDEFMETYTEVDNE